MKVVLVIERRFLLWWGQIMTRDKGAKRSHPKWENLWKNTLKEKDLKVVVNLRSRSKKNKTKKHRRYSSLQSPSSSSNDGSDEIKYRNNEGKKGTYSRFRVVSEENQYKCSLPPDIDQYANANFDTYIKEADLIKAALIKLQSQKISIPWKSLTISWNISLKNKKRQKDLDVDNVLENIQGRNRSALGPLSKIWTAVELAKLSQKDSVEVDLKEIQ